jgi:hypothetical protein
MKEGAETKDYGIALDLFKETAILECPNWKKNNITYL